MLYVDYIQFALMTPCLIPAQFLNRLDETVVFEPLSATQLREIARLQVRVVAVCTFITAEVQPRCLATGRRASMFALPDRSPPQQELLYFPWPSLPLRAWQCILSALFLCAYFLIDYD